MSENRYIDAVMEESARVDDVMKKNRRIDDTIVSRHIDDVTRDEECHVDDVMKDSEHIDDFLASRHIDDDITADEKCDVIVIGAGLSGLNAARLLSRCGSGLSECGRGLKVVVLEARDRVGGRTFSIKNSDTFQYCDLGGAYINPGTDKRLLSIIDELQLHTYPCDGSNTNLKPLFHCNGKSRTELISNPLERVDVHRVHALIESMYKEVPIAEPWKAQCARLWDEMTLKEFVDKTCWTQLSRQRGYELGASTFGCEAHEVSLLAVLWVLAARGGMKSLLGAYGPGELKVVGGSQEVSLRLAEKLDVRMSSPVVRVDQSDPSVVRVTTSTGRVFNAPYVVCSIPITLLNRITFCPSLPGRKIQLIQRIPMASVIKTMTYYRQAFWKDKLALSGAMSTDSFPISACMDDTKPDGSSPCLMGFITGNNARCTTDLTEGERKNLITRQYAQIFGSDEFLHPSQYVEQNWMAEEYSGGCYVSGFPPGVLMTFGESLRLPVDRVHFAGTETARECMGYMEGALESGERAANEILQLVTNDNTNGSGKY